MLLDIKFCCLLFLLSCWNHHCLVRAVNLEKDRHFFCCFIIKGLSILDCLILRISIFLVDQVVQNETGVGKFEAFTVTELDIHIFRETFRK
jgi:hypothetical protein